MRRFAGALLTLCAACAPPLRRADIDAEMRALARERERLPPAPTTPRRAEVRVIRLRAEETSAPGEPPSSSSAEGVRVQLRAALPTRPAAASRPVSTARPPPLVVGERLAVVPLPRAFGVGSAGLPPGALAPSPGPRAETTVPVASTGVLDRGASDAYDDALSLVRADRCHDAIDAFASFVARWPDHPHADNAMYWRGECLLRIGETRRGIEELTALVDRFPTGNKAPDALLKLSLTWRRLGDEARAQQAAQRLLQDFPVSDAARRVRVERQMR